MDQNIQHINDTPVNTGDFDIRQIIPPDADEIIDDFQSLLINDSVQITPYLSVVNPSVIDVMNNDINYYSMVSAFTSNPLSYAVQLHDEMHLDYTKVTEYELFFLFFQRYVEIFRANVKNDSEMRLVNKMKQAMSLIFKDIDISKFVALNIPELGGIVFYNPYSKTLINEFIYQKIADALRHINQYEHDTSKAGNAAYAEYELEKQRRRLKRQKRKKFKHFLEEQVIALVNNKEFKYNYDETLHLSLYRFNRSLKQTTKLMTHLNTMHGVYAGTVDTKKIKDKSVLKWFSLDDGIK